jgi:hypothetical protein
MGKASFKPEIVKHTQKGFADVWTAIEEYVQTQDQLSLRDAANIIGFRSFPVGWTWTEYGLRKTAKTRPYEAKAQKTSRFGIPALSTSEPEGLIAGENAVRFRSESAQKSLYRITFRMNVPVRIYDADAYGRIADERDLLDQTLQFNVADGSISLHGYKERAEIDGPRLIKHLNRATASWEKRPGKHDWLLAERLARDVFELHGCRFSDLGIIDRCRDQYKTIRPNSSYLDQSAYAALVATLRREYVSDE